MEICGLTSGDYHCLKQHHIPVSLFDPYHRDTRKHADDLEDEEETDDADDTNAADTEDPEGADDTDDAPDDADDAGATPDNAGDTSDDAVNTEDSRRKRLRDSESHYLFWFQPNIFHSHWFAL